MYASPLALTLWLLACTQPAVDDSVAPVEDSTGTDSDSSASIPEDSPVVTEEEVEDQSDVGLDDWFFTNDTIHVIALTIPDDGLAALDATPYDKTLADVTIDGYALDQVGVRLRGKVGSFRYMSGKPKFAIDVNYINTDQRFFGIEEISLNNEVVDCGYLKEPLAYRIFRDAGVPAPRTSFARVSVNGADYGLYVIVETPDDRFLKRNFEDPSGNLYDGKYVYYEDHTYTLLDFSVSVQDLFQLEEGTDFSRTDVNTVVSAAATPNTGDDWYNIVNDIVDLPTMSHYLAVEELVGHNDGYALNTNNYRFYFDPLNAGRMSFVPWDFDYGFLHDYEWGMNWTTPRGVLAAGCFYNTLCGTEHKQAVSDLLATFDPALYQTWFDELTTLIADDVVSDPRRECAIDYVYAYQANTRAWLSTEPTNMRTRWGVE